MRAPGEALAALSPRSRARSALARACTRAFCVGFADACLTRCRWMCFFFSPVLDAGRRSMTAFQDWRYTTVVRRRARASACQPVRGEQKDPCADKARLLFSGSTPSGADHQIAEETTGSRR